MKDNTFPTKPKEERQLPVGSTPGMGSAMGKAKRDQSAGCTPCMPADEMRQGRQIKDGIGRIANGMAGSTREEAMKSHVPLTQGKRKPGDRP